MPQERFKIITIEIETPCSICTEQAKYKIISKKKLAEFKLCRVCAQHLPILLKGKTHGQNSTNRTNG